MGRAPCCEKVGLNRGPWTKEEDQILINFINQDGHGNWRALPKKAGLLRCGKSCRLRWTNYLRPDIIRGNFTKEEEDNIIAFHKELGNKWSVIASKLPGRTDNEIKNVWHTHLKKRLVDKNNAPLEHKKRIRKRTKKMIEAKKDTLGTLKSNKQEDWGNLNTKEDEKNSPSQEAKSQNSSLTTMSTSGCSASTPESMEEFVIDDEFWTDVFSGDCPNMDVNQISESQFAMPSFMDMVDFDPSRDEDMDFWHEFFTKEGELPELL